MGCGSGGKTVARVDISASRDLAAAAIRRQDSDLPPIELDALASSLTTPGRGSAVRSLKPS